METTTVPLACPIGELPDELLVAIAAQLHIERGFLADEEAEHQRCCENALAVRSLHAMAISCRKLNAVANPLLYRCVVQTQRELFVPLLLRTLFGSPKLGRHVRYIEFATLDDIKLELLDQVSLDYVKKKLPRAPRRIRSSRSTVNSLSRVIRTVFDAEHTLSFLLSTMDNLQYAALPDSRAVLKALAFTHIARAQKLRHLWLRQDLSMYGEEYREYALRVFVSNTRDCSEHLVRYLHRFCFPMAVLVKPKPSPTMTEISLTVQDVNFVQLDDHLKDCASLERFSCRWQWTDKFIPRNPIYLPALRNSLLQVCKTLTHLTIDTSDSASQVDMDASIPALGSLRAFKALIYLNVAGLVLWGDDDIAEPVSLSLILPESLETLIIKSEWDDDVEDALHQLSIDCTSSLPSLKEVECRWRPAPRYIAGYLIDTFCMIGVALALDIEDA